MKRINFLLSLVLVFLICSAQQCNKSSKDLLTRLYNKAYTSRIPLEGKKDNAYEPAIGSWILENEKGLIVSKTDAQHLEFRFLSDDIDQNDVLYKGHTITLNGKKYLNLLAYQDNYMFFQVESKSKGQIDVRMITTKVYPKLGGGNLSQFLRKNNINDTSVMFYPISFVLADKTNLLSNQQDKFRAQVYSINQYKRYENMFPKDTGLVRLKQKALDNTLNNAASVKTIYELANQYPEIKDKAQAKALSGCKTTNWCMEYIEIYSFDAKHKDSIRNLAFNLATTSEDFYSLLKKFPHEERSKGLTSKIAIAEYKKMSAGYSASFEESRLQNKYPEYPEIITIYNTLKLFGNINIETGDFAEYSYILNKKGKNKLNQMIDLIKMLNIKEPELKTFYLSISDKKEYVKNDKNIPLKSSVNKGLSIKKYLESKMEGLSIRIVPCGDYRDEDFDTAQVFGRFYLSDERIRADKKAFYRLCYTTRQTVIIPDAENELMNTEYIREEEFEQYLVEQLKNQYALYKAKKKFSRVIPANYWDTQFEKTTPYFHEIRQQLLKSCGEFGLDQKTMQQFVFPIE